MPINNAAGTGNGATAVFTTSGFAGKYKQIGELSQKLKALEADHLGTEDQNESVPDDLFDPGEIEFEFYFRTIGALPALGTLDTLTVTFPLRAGEGAAAGYTGSGFLTERSLPKMVNSELMMAKLKFKFDGRVTKFAYTPATASP